MVYSIDYLNNGHMYPMQLMQIFSSASCVRQLIVIIPERLNQIYNIVAHRWIQEVFSFHKIGLLVAEILHFECIYRYSPLQSNFDSTQKFES